MIDTVATYGKVDHDKNARKLNEVIEALNDLTREVEAQGEEVTSLMATVFAAPEDNEDDGGDCDHDICPDCWAETEPFIANLPDLSDEQLIALHDRVADLLDERLEDDDEEMHIKDVHFYRPDGREMTEDEVCSFKKQPREIDTTDGLFSDFTAYVTAHPELRFYQALTNWSGYKRILGEDKGEDQYDLFHKTTKGPNA